MCTIIIQLHKVEYKKRASRAQISRDIVPLFAQLVILYLKKSLFN